MLQLTQSNCLTIDAISDQIDLLINNPGIYSTAKVVLKKNCCGTEYTDTESISTSLGYSFTINFPATVLLMSSIYFSDNTTIGLGNESVASCSDLITLFTTKLASTFPDITFECAISTNNMFSVIFTSSLPIAIPISVNFIVNSSSLSSTSYFASNKKFYFANGILSISPSIIGNITNFEDAVYNISLTFILVDGTIVNQSGCIFVDCLTKCRTAKAVSLSTGQTVTDLIMYHYGLSFAQDCMCDCDYLCDLFTNLTTLLDSIVPDNNITNGCGCT